VEPILLIILVVLLVLFVVWGGARSLGGLIVNAILGIALLFLTNLFITPPIPINILTVLICAIGGVLGWLVILILHVLGIAFYVSV
jgi:SigmaK-factor processing regulatory protein BofA